MILPIVSGLQVFAAVCIICFFEAMGLILQTRWPPVFLLAALRSGQLISLFILLFCFKNKQNGAVITLKHLYSGIRTGLKISFFFGIGVCITGMALTVAGIDLFALISVQVPKTHTYLFLLTAIILGPITEELFFRGIVYSFLRPSGILAAVVISTGMFALSHYSGNGFPFIQVIGGLVFAASFEYTRNLVTPMTIHLLGNLLIYLTG